MREIKLTQGRVAIVDAEDYESLSKHNWYVSNGYAIRRDHKTTVRMHRQIMDFPDSQVDHISGNRLDNRRCNLRLATNAENSRNARKKSINTSGVIGVSWNKGKWQAQIRADDGRKNLGYYTDIFRAMMAVDIAKLRYHGEFAYTNLPKTYYSNLVRFQRKMKI